MRQWNRRMRGLCAALALVLLLGCAAEPLVTDPPVTEPPVVDGPPTEDAERPSEVRAEVSTYEALMSTLREDEGELEKAVEVYETIRNLHPSSPEAEAALVKEATDRMTLLRARGYNKERCLDTVLFLKTAVAASADRSFRDVLAHYLSEAVSLMEDEAYKSAKYYDSRTRTRRSAISAYERFLVEFPASVHADAVRERLAELRGEQEAK